MYLRHSPLTEWLNGGGTRPASTATMADSTRVRIDGTQTPMKLLHMGHDDYKNQELDVLVIGGGFSGCRLLYELRKAGFNVKLVEAGSDL